VLSADVVAAIDDLELAARGIVEGLRVGGHRSPLHGYGAEFQQHRPYRTGDDLKALDWKVYARSDRLYTRQYRETTNVAVMLVLDTSASMAFPDASHAVSKFRYAVLCAAALAYLAIEQGNAVGLLTTDARGPIYLPARSGRVALRALLTQLARLQPQGTWDGAGVLRRAAELLPRRGLVLVLSDFYDDEAAMQRELRHVARRGHDVAMLQIVAPEERALGMRGTVELRDLERGTRRLVDASSLAASYADAHRAFRSRCRTFAESSGIDYALCDTGEPPARALRTFLVQRGGGARLTDDGA
jgi:uncharacterized protein (DUF58 family)